MDDHNQTPVDPQLQLIDKSTGEYADAIGRDGHSVAGHTLKLSINRAIIEIREHVMEQEARIQKAMTDLTALKERIDKDALDSHE